MPQSWGWALLCRRSLYPVVKDLRRLTYVLLSPASLSIIYYSHPYPLPLLSANVNDSQWCHPHLFSHVPSELPSIATSTPPPCAFFIYDATAASTTAITLSWQRLWFCWTSLVSCEWKTWEEKIVSGFRTRVGFSVRHTTGAGRVVHSHLTNHPDNNHLHAIASSSRKKSWSEEQKAAWRCEDSAGTLGTAANGDGRGAPTILSSFFLSGRTTSVCFSLSISFCAKKAE